MRGFYDGLDRDSASLSHLAKDIGLLMLEKDRTQKSELFTQIIDLNWLWVLIILLVIVFMIYFTQRRKING